MKIWYFSERIQSEFSSEIVRSETRLENSSCWEKEKEKEKEKESIFHVWSNFIDNSEKIKEQDWSIKLLNSMMKDCFDFWNLFLWSWKKINQEFDLNFFQFDYEKEIF